jgi:hypothetical protein
MKFKFRLGLRGCLALALGLLLVRRLEVLGFWLGVPSIPPR